MATIHTHIFSKSNDSLFNENEYQYKHVVYTLDILNSNYN